MRVLIAEDDPVFRRMLEATLSQWGYDPIVTTTGLQAWEVLCQEHPPRLAMLDWVMPGMDGVDICRRMRETPAMQLTYVILVTSRDATQDIVAGLEAGANDYITKPYDRAELQARLGVGVRVVDLQQSLADRVKELQEALAEVRQLQGILPICSYCKKVRSDQKYWERVEDYISAHSEVAFSHAICPECWETVVQPQIQEMGWERIPYEE